MFYLIGLGLYDYEDLSLKGLRLLKECDYVFFERYTNLFSNEDIEMIEKLSGKEIVELSRHDLESGFEGVVLKKALDKKVALLIPGDPLTATTHVEFLKACKENNVEYRVVHASSIHSSVCETGLHVYKFGRSCSIPYPEQGYNPTSYFDVIEKNHEVGAHTLVFLDIKKDLEKYMSVNEALQLLLKVSKERKGFFNENTKLIGISRLGSDEQIIKYNTVKELLNFNFGPSPHIIIIPAMSEIEEEYVKSLY